MKDNLPSNIYLNSSSKHSLNVQVFFFLLFVCFCFSFFYYIKEIMHKPCKQFLKAEQNFLNKLNKIYEHSTKHCAWSYSLFMNNSSCKTIELSTVNRLNILLYFLFWLICLIYALFLAFSYIMLKWNISSTYAEWSSFFSDKFTCLCIWKENLLEWH